MDSSTDRVILCIIRFSENPFKPGDLVEKTRRAHSELRKAARMNPDALDPIPHSDASLEFAQDGAVAGSTCALLTPAIRAKLREMDSGQILEVRVDDPAAREDILSWSRLSGHVVLAMRSYEPNHLRVFLRKK